MTALTYDPGALATRTRQVGRELFEVIGRGPSVRDRQFWDDRLMNLTMADAGVRVQLFRFIDALPGLRTADDVRRHLAEYLGEAGENVPWYMNLAVALAPAGSAAARILATTARSAASHMARRFIAGENPAEALATVRRLRGEGSAFTADLLGEAVISDHEADVYQQTCLDLIRGLAPPLAADAERPRIDRDDLGPIPRANLSLKLTSLTARFDALHGEATTLRVAGRLRPILREAMRLGAFVNVDMEQYVHKDLTYAIFRSVLSEAEFCGWHDVGIVAQAYLPEAEADLRSLAEWAEHRGAPVTVRLVKGAYWDYEVLLARQFGWPVPVYQKKAESDASFERCSRFLLEHRRWLRPAFGSHNVRSLANALATAELLGVPPDGFEVQVLNGMGAPIQRAVAARGHRVRVYTPYGAILPGMAYLVRRLLENTSNESFLKASFTDRAEVDDLLRDPEETVRVWYDTQKLRRKPPAPAAGLPPFRNEPLTDFSRPAARLAMTAALARVDAALGKWYDLRIAGRPVEAAETLESTDPRRLHPGDRPVPQGHARPCRNGRRRPPAPPSPPGPPRPRRSGPGCSSAPPRSSATAGPSWPPGRSASAANPGGRPTPTSPRRSTSASSTPGR